MLKYEIFETLRQTFLTLSFGLILPIVFWINEVRLNENKPFGHYAESGVMILLTFLVIRLAYTMFASEDREGAGEYLKSLPISKLKLLCFKILPRLTLSLVLTLFYVLIVGPLAGLFTISEYLVVAVPIVILMFSGFLIGISDRRNPILAAMLLLPVFYWLLIGPLASHALWGELISRTEFLYRITGSSVVQFRLCKIFSDCVVNLLPAILPALVLLPMYRTWDSSSGKIRGQKMLKILLGPSALIIGISILTISRFF